MPVEPISEELEADLCWEVQNSKNVIFVSGKKNRLTSSTLNPHIFFFFDPRPEKRPEIFLPNPQFFRYVGFQWLLRKRVLKNGNYLETRFSEKKIKKFWVVEISANKKKFGRNFFF